MWTIPLGSLGIYNGDLISVEVKIGERLATISDKEISYMPGTTGKAEIIVEDLRLIERFFYQLRNIFNM
ncbi:hypothetical protein [Flagellimonas alvinocaridis]|uniref:hypothetical protein n=1 Tax=Flagellimonas alvinocaridis TaxID=2530200 RepID=UPI00191C37ED|nr:hypothetical protein [Allomuricauda alvinocaridis]